MRSSKGKTINDRRRNNDGTEVALLLVGVSAGNCRVWVPMTFNKEAWRLYLL